jgi:hypothetical protein
MEAAATTEKAKPVANGVAPKKGVNLRERYTDAQRKKFLGEFLKAPDRHAWAKKNHLAVSMLHRWRHKFESAPAPKKALIGRPPGAKTKTKTKGMPRAKNLAKRIRADLLKALHYHTQMAVTYKSALEALSGIR